MKRCGHCGTEKPEAAFYNDRTRSDGLFPWCKACHQAENRRTYPERREALSARRRVARRTPQGDAERARDRFRHERDKNDPDYRQRRYRDAVWTRYRLTPDQLAWLLTGQEFRCALCAKDFGVFKPHLDHDHGCCAGRTICGRCVRGYLCDNCNRRVLPVLEAQPRLQSPFVMSYLAQRPFGGSAGE